MNWHISGYALKRIVLRRMRASGVSPLKLRAAARIRFPLLPYEGILGTSTKVEKNLKRGMLTAIIYLAPEKLSVPYGGKNMCPWATTCKGPCLSTKRRLGPGSDGENAELWRTLTYIWARREFRVILFKALRIHQNHADGLTLRCGVRPNGGSDVIWETVMPDMFGSFPRTEFYDYTKSIKRMFRPRPPNYDLTFSFDGVNLVNCKRVLRSKQNVAIVFTDPVRALALKTYHGYPLLDGDADDDRPSDPKGRWVVLSPKGGAHDDTGFFIVNG